MTDGADLRQLLDRGLAGGEPGWSRSSHAIAAYLRDNWHSLPYETGASIAVAVEVSEMTVIRFIRQLGFNNLRDIKDALKSAEPREPGEMPEIIQRPPPALLPDPAQDRDLKAEIEGITAAYRLTALPAWRAATDLLAKSEFLSLTGFGALKGQAQDLTTRLQQLRPQARFIADSTGNTAEILDLTGRSHCLMMLEDGTSALRAGELGAKAKALSIPMIVLTSGNAQWAHEISGTVLHLPGKPAPLWPSPLPVAAALNLLLRDVAGLIGPAASERFARLTGTTPSGGAVTGAAPSARHPRAETALRLHNLPRAESSPAQPHPVKPPAPAYSAAPMTLPPRDPYPIPQAPEIRAALTPAPIPLIEQPLARFETPPETSAPPPLQTPTETTPAPFDAGDKAGAEKPEASLTAAPPTDQAARPIATPATSATATPAPRASKPAEQGRLF